MTRQRFWAAALLTGFAQGVLCLPLMADEVKKQESEQKIIESLEKIVFVPHDVGAPEVTDAGGVRGISTAPKLLGLAPERLARSLSPSPTIYWYVSKGTETPVRFTLFAEGSDAANPLLDIDLGAHAEPGIYAVPLADYGVQLEGMRRYSWSLDLVSAEGGSSGEPVVQTWLEHSPSADIVAFLETNPPFEQTALLAGEGYWYDALDVVSEQIEAGDQSVPWREVRAHLLDQVGLKQVAIFDRQQTAQ